MASAIAAMLWVFAATAVACLPMSYQKPPGLALLIAAPLVVVWLGSEHGGVVAGLGVYAVLSMYRKPLVYYARRLTGSGEGV